MPYSSGTFNLYTPGNPVTTGTTVSSTWANNTLADIAAGLSNAVTRDGQSPATNNLPMGGFKHANVNTATATNEYARADQVQNSSFTMLTGVTGTNTITATAPLTMAAYASGQRFHFIAANTNTAGVTININGIGARTITKNGAQALTAGDIVQGCVVAVLFDGTNFQLETVTLFGDGTAAAPSISHAGDNNTGLFFPAADTVAVSTNGTERVRVDSIGNVNIATAGARITGDFSNATVANRVMFQTSTTNGATRVEAIPNGTGTTANLSAYNNSDPTNAAATRLTATSTESRVESVITGTGTYLPMAFWTGGAERMRIDTSGNVGVGTASPQRRIQSTISATPAASQAAKTGLLITNNDITGTSGSPNTVVIQFAYDPASPRAYIEAGTFGNDLLAFGTGGTERMRIDSSGNVGIGTASPASLGAGRQSLTLNGSTDSLLWMRANAIDTGYLQATTTNLSLVGASNINVSCTAQGNGVFTVATGANERLRIGASGQLGIGGANYGNAGDVLVSGGSGAAPSWANVTISGSYQLVSGYTSGTTRTNTYGKTIIVTASPTFSGGGVSVVVAGTTIMSGSNSNFTAPFAFAVPAGATWSITAGAGTGNVYELR